MIVLCAIIIILVIFMGTEQLIEIIEKRETKKLLDREDSWL